MHLLDENIVIDLNSLAAQLEYGGGQRTHQSFQIV